MSKAKEILLKVKALFDAPIPVPAPAVPVVAALSTQTLKTVDGTEVTITCAGEMPAIGDMVTIAGNPAPAGDIQIEDGSVISVDPSGAIASITTPAEPAGPTEPAEPAVNMSAQLEARIAALEAEIQKLRTPVTEMSAESKAAFEKHEKVIVKNDEVIKGLFELVEEMAAQPTAEPKALTGSKKDQFDRSNAREKKLNAFAESIADLKKKNK